MTEDPTKIPTLNEKLNKKQLEIATTLEGTVLADAGPGTGKTSTITERYVNMIVEGIDPAKILTVTFTRNSAKDMRRKITERLIGIERLIADNDELREVAERLSDAQKKIRTSTFDAYCLKIVQNAPEAVSEFFEIGETLSRGATLIENEALNRNYFASFYAEFTKEYGHLYNKKAFDAPMVAADKVSDLYYLIVRLMSYGVIPLADDSWFVDGGDKMVGDIDEVTRRVDALCKANNIPKMSGDYSGLPPVLLKDKNKREGETLSDKCIESIANEDRTNFIYFIRHVYYEYIRRSVRDNRLTFALVKIFAFAVLFQSKYAREQNSVDYLVVDEFQDTDEIQLKICLMLLNTNNLCVVGDWKQGIYGFRNATVDNILEFGKRIELFSKQLKDCVRGDFKADRCKEIKMDINYRSTEAILKPAFRALEAPGTKTEIVRNKEGSITELTSFNDSDEGKYHDLYREYTATEYLKSQSKDREYVDLVDKVTEYVYSGKYKIVEEDGTVRDPRFEDIGVLFRTYRGCNGFFNEAFSRGIPVFMQGDVEVLTTVPGKIALAWLRFVNDRNDKRGAVAIMIHEGFSMAQIKAMLNEAKKPGVDLTDVMPKYLVEERDFLERRRRRPNDLLTSVFAFHRIGEGDGQSDIVQTIVNIVSSSYNGSLVTIPDIIRIFEDSFKKSDKYPVDSVLGRNAITVQTIHKSKGLEYPIVIVGGLNMQEMPNTQGDSSIFTYDEIYGIRCKKECVSVNEMTGIADSWRYKLLHMTDPMSYYEERRLLFVAMSRAKQYMLVAAGPNASQFFDFLTNGEIISGAVAYDVPVEDRSDTYTDTPEIPPYTRRRQNVAVHDIMKYVEGDGEGQGKEHGNKVHEAAELMFHNREYDTALPEMKEIAKIKERVKDAFRIETEYECALPAKQATLRGVIDLFADFGDRIEIHDYKTDVDKRNLDSYILQLSVYGLAAQQSRNVPVRCFIDFVSIPELYVEVKLLSMEEIQSRVDAYLEESVKV